MRRKQLTGWTGVLVLSCLLPVVPPLSAQRAMGQDAAAFNGTWQVDPDRTRVAADAAPGRFQGPELVAITLRVTPVLFEQERAGRGGLVKESYPLDGKPIRVEQGQASGSARAFWVGKEIHVESSVSGEGRPPFQNKSVFSLQEGRLVVTRVSIAPDGRTRTVTAVYRRQPA